MKIICVLNRKRNPHSGGNQQKLMMGNKIKCFEKIEIDFIRVLTQSMPKSNANITTSEICDLNDIVSTLRAKHNVMKGI